MVWFYLVIADKAPFALIVFQSHYGLILSHKLLQAYSTWESPFNPTMVWFYLHQKPKRTVISCYFQSHYGLILSFTTFAALYERRKNAFQSHYGLILSGFTPERDQKTQETFNPTMVWFYPKSCNWRNTPKRVFQSHYGLILSFFSYDLLCINCYILSIPLWSDFITRTEHH